MALPIPEFEWKPGPRIVGGPGSIDRLGQLADELGARRVAIISDSGVRTAGHVDRAVQSLQASHMTPAVFDDVHENPTSQDVAAGAQQLATHHPDLLVGLGGGSAMDCAKGVSFLLTHGGRMEDYWGYGKTTVPLIPLIAVPTTAGTGSEAQSYALITHPQTHAKMACGDPGALPKIAVLDPQLLTTAPPRVAALAAADAVSHVVESFVTLKRQRTSRMFAREAFRHLSAALPGWLAHPTDEASLSGLQWGACLAGMAIENSMLGAAHALANPLTALAGITHGQAVAVMLPHVVRYNQPACGADYAELLRAIPGAGSHHHVDLFGILTEWFGRLGLALDLLSLGVDESLIPQLAQLAVQQWTAQFNPRPVTETAAAQLYRAAFSTIVANRNIG